MEKQLSMPNCRQQELRLTPTSPRHGEIGSDDATRRGEVVLSLEEEVVGHEILFWRGDIRWYAECILFS